MADDARLNFADLLERLLDAAYRHALPSVDAASTTLGASMVREALSETSGRLHIPYYWAVFVHEGRAGPIRPQTARVLVWFRHPLRDDPRLDGGYPKRQQDARRLSPSEYREGLQKNREARLRGEPPVMLVRKIVTKGIDPKPFFSNTGGMAGFRQEADAIIRDWLRDEVRRMLPEARRTIRVEL